MNAASWVKWFPSDFLNGIAEMEPNEIAVYTVVLNRIYDEGGPIPDDERVLARRCNMRPTSCAKALESLARQGKIVRRDGLITNRRCEKAIETRQKVSEKSAEIARTSWQKRREKTNENNDGAVHRHKNGICQTDAIPDTRYQIPEDRDANASLSVPGEPTPAAASDTKPKRSRASYPADFEAFWSDYPTDPVMSKKEAAQEWARLTPEDRAACHRTVPAFRAYCAANPTYRPVHACRYISQRRFESVADPRNRNPRRDEQPAYAPRPSAAERRTSAVMAAIARRAGYEPAGGLAEGPDHDTRPDGGGKVVDLFASQGDYAAC